MRFSPSPSPIPITDVPPCLRICFISAKSTLTYAGVITKFTIPLTALTNISSATLNASDIGLIIDDIIEPGEFDFGITVNETLERRNIWFKPRVICDGATAQLPDGKQRIHLSGAVSKQMFGEDFIYWFKLDTLDFTSIIPKDTTCRFELEVFDRHGTHVPISKQVKFVYASGNDNYFSIRGKATDIVDYMESVLEGQINRGFNHIHLDVVGNEDSGDTKELSVTVTSRALGIHISEQTSVEPGERVSIDLPIFISEDLAPGMYPVRFSVYDGENMQTRYSYIRVD